jgi:YD repeat-containing protein
MMNRLDHIGGGGKTVVEGQVSEFASVAVTSGTATAKAATLTSDPAGGGYRFRAEVDVQEGSNTLAVSATDRDTPPQTTTQNYSFNLGGVQRSFTYDANGNMLTESQNGNVTRRFEWDAKNRLKVVFSGTSVTGWSYDYRDRRVHEWRSSSNGDLSGGGPGPEYPLPAYPQRLLIWDGDNLVQERSVTSSTNFTTGGTIARTHHHGGFTDGTGTTAKDYLTTTDHLGNVREVIAANTAAGTIGNVLTRYDYTAFQGPVKLSGSVDASR